MPDVPETMSAVILEEAGHPLHVRTIATPRPCAGGVVVKILYTWVDASILTILSGKAPSFSFPIPMVPGTRAIGRIATLGPDSTSMRVGGLVLLEPNVRARDDPNVQFIWGAYGGSTKASQKLAADNWRHGCMAEFALAPLENCWPLNEDVHCNRLGYSLENLLHLTVTAVPYGGLRAINLQPGETVLIAPATGRFSGAAVGVAAAMGATVVAVGRRQEVLDELKAKHGRVTTVHLKGTDDDVAAMLRDAGPVDVYLDFSPPAASGAQHLRACFEAVRKHGRVALMGIIKDDVPIPYSTVMWKSLTIRGQYMYQPGDFQSLIRLAESGLLKLGNDAGQRIIGRFALDDFSWAFEAAERYGNALQSVVLRP